MSPTGYADWIRVQDWDSPVLATINTGATANPYSTAVLNVSRYGYLCGSLSLPVVANIQVNVTWWMDEGATVKVGERVIFLSSLIGGPLRFNILNLGPWVRIDLQVLGLGNYDVTGTVFATNRATPLEFIPVNGVIIDEQNIPIPAAGQIVYPLDYFAGPMQVWAQSGGAAWILGLQNLTANNVWETLANAVIQGSPGTAVTFVAPPTAWRFVMAGTGVLLNNNYLMVAPSVTGAA